MQSTELNVKFKDFEILEIIQMEREHNSHQLSTVGLKCEMFNDKEIEMIWVMTRALESYTINDLILDFLDGAEIFNTLLDSIEDGRISRDFTFDQLCQHVAKEFSSNRFDVRY